MTLIQSWRWEVFIYKFDGDGGVSAHICGYLYILSWISHAWGIHQTIHQWSSSAEMRYQHRHSVMMQPLEKQWCYTLRCSTVVRGTLYNLVISCVTLYSGGSHLFSDAVYILHSFCVLWNGFSHYVFVLLSFLSGRFTRERRLFVEVLRKD